MRRILAAMIASVTALLLTATVAPADARSAVKGSDAQRLDQLIHAGDTWTIG
jgi:hypothetical protein